MTIVPFDNRDGFIWMDGEMVAWREAKIHMLSHGLHYGGGVFEGLRCYDGKIFKLDEHTARLLDGCRQVDMKIKYSAAEINQACLDIIKINNVKNGYIRPFVWRGPEDMVISARNISVHLSVSAWEWPTYFSGDALEKGISLTISKWRRPAPDSEPVHVKASGLYLVCSIAKDAALNAGFTDALMLDYRGHVAELTAANFFIVQNGELHTPTSDCFLNGITRQTVIEIAHQKGIKVIERTIMPEELSKAEECFATGTAAEITPIGRIDSYTYNVGPITKALISEYEKRVGKK